MCNIEFTPEEVDVLREMLQKNLNDIKVEVFHTATHDFKEILKQRRELIQHLLDKLDAVSVPA